MKKVRIVLIAVWTAALTALVLAKNPSLLNPELYEQSYALDDFHRAPFVLRAEQIQNLDDSTFTYRENIHRTGQSTLLTSLSIKEVWQSEQLNFGIHTASKSSPAMDESGIYVGSDTGWIYAYNHDGSLRWQFLTTGAPQGVHGSATLDEHYVYIGSYNGRLYCLKKDTGDLVWSTLLADAIGDVPAIHGDALYVAAEYMNPREGLLYKIDRKTGSIVWRSEYFKEQVHSSPTLDPDNDRVFVGTNNSDVRAFSMSTGASIWSFLASGPIKGTAAFHQGALYFTAWGEKAFKLDSGSGALIWEADLENSSQSSPALIPEYDIMVYLSHRENSHIYGTKMSTGKIVWKFPLKGNMEALGSPVALRLKNSPNEWIVWSQCFARTLCAINPKNGNILKTVSLPGELTSVPSFDKKGFVVSLNYGGLVRYNYE